MRRFLACCLLLLSTLSIKAQTLTFVGDLTIDGWTQSNIKATLNTDANGKGTIVLYDIKMNKAIPFRVNTTIAGFKVETSEDEKLTCTGSGLVPYVGKTAYPKFPVNKFKGVVVEKKATVDCLLGKQKVHFTGKQK